MRAQVKGGEIRIADDPCGHGDMWRDTGMTTTDQQNEFIQSLNGDLNPTQAAQLLEMSGQGDTGATSPELAAQPGAATATAEGTTSSDAGTTGANTSATAAPAASTPAAAPDATPAAASELTAANAVILAKDGKHTIGYEKLVEAREGEKHWKAQAEAAQTQLAELQAQAKTRADAGQTPTQTDAQVAAAQAAIDQGIDPGIFGDFSEEDLAKGIQTLVDAKVAAKVDAIVAQKLAPIQQKHATEASDSHYAAIYKAHPDADSLAESKELGDWINTQPSFVRDGYNAVLQKGSTQQVIELFSAFKQATGTTQGAGAGAAAGTEQVNSEAVKAAAQAAIATAPSRVPASLTDLPGGRPAGLSRDEQMADMNGRELLDAMGAGNMTPEQIERFLNTL